LQRAAGSNARATQASSEPALSICLWRNFRRSTIV